MGIDFGTTRTVVAWVEGGNYPLVTFEAEWGDGQEWYPSLIAGKGSKRVFGWEAWSKQSEEGRQISFDPIFPKDTLLPTKGEPPLLQSRRYHPVHNIGHFRYLECSHLNEQGQPTGDLTTWDEIRFPFDPDLTRDNGWEKVSIQRFEPSMHLEAEEIYTCDSQGIVKVTLINHSNGFQKSYQLRHGA